MIRVLVILISISSFSAIAQNDYYYRIHPQWTRLVDGSLSMDVNLDGTDEFFFKLGDQYDLRDPELEFYYKSFKFFHKEPHMILPIPASRMDSIYFQVTFQRLDTIFVKLLPPTPKSMGKSMQQEPLLDLFRFVRNERTAPSDFKQSFKFLSHIKTTGGKQLTLFSTSTPWDPNGIRAVYAMDYKRQKLYWTFSHGPYLINTRIVDLNRDGSDEILLSSYASNNGVSGQSSKDDSSYVFLLGSDGRVIWQRSFGGFWTGAFADVGDFYGDGRPRVVCFQYSTSKTKASQDRAYILDAESGRILLEKRFGERFRPRLDIDSKICADLNGDDRDEIVMGNSDGYMRIFNGDLQVLRQSRRYDGPLEMHGIVDLNGDGLFEIIAVQTDEKMIVFDHELNELCSYRGSTGERLFPRIVNAGGGSFLVMQTPAEQKIRVTLYELQQSIFPFESERFLNRYTVVLLIFLPLLGVWLYFYYRRALYRQFLQLVSSLPNRFREHVLLLKKNGEVNFAGQQVLEWLQMPLVDGSNLLTLLRLHHPEQIREIKQLLNRRQSILRTEMSGQRVEIRAFYFRSLRLIGLLFVDPEEADHIRQVKLWARVAQRLAHGIKNPLTSVKLNAQELKFLLQNKYQLQDDEIPEYLDAITSQVSKLKRMTDGFMHFVEFERPVLQRLDINTLLQQWVQEWSVNQPPYIQLDWDLADDLPLVQVDKEQFAFAFRNVYFNAVESIEKRGSISISTRRIQFIEANDSVRHYIEIQVQDTGKGIAAEYLDKVKQPYFTLKPEGTGLGLSIVEKIMQSHRGSFAIDSRVGVGTTVTLRLPV
jgi:signal transduction histidine kinase